MDAVISIIISIHYRADPISTEELKRREARLFAIFFHKKTTGNDKDSENDINSICSLFILY